MNKGTDYTVVYEDNKKVGTATVIFTGTGNFKGFHVENFTIRPKSTILRKLIKGKKQFSVVWKKQTTQMSGYQIQYATNKKFKSSKKVTSKKSTTRKTIKKLKSKKTYYVRVRSYTVKGGKTYYGNWSDAKSIVTAKTNFANAKVSGISSKSFTGKAITQKITVKYGSKTLKNGTDYTVKYSANTKVGTAKVTITGKGIYGGVITKSFAIYPAKQVIQKLYGTYAGFFIDYAQKGSATGYEISYSQRSDFNGAKSVKVTNNRTDKKTVSGLARYQKYYVRVRSYTVKGGKTYNGAWSEKKWVYTQ